MLLFMTHLIGPSRTISGVSAGMSGAITQIAALVGGSRIQPPTS